MAIIPSTLPPRFEHLLLESLGDARPKDLAARILRLSDHYNQALGEPTPWHETYARQAYLAYFMPLNFVRLKAAFNEVKRFLTLSEITEVWDIGSGSGTTQFVLENESAFPPRPFYNIETAREAILLHQELAGRFHGAWKPEFSARIEPRPGALGIFSYSFLEAQLPLPVLQKFDHLLLVEPSVRELGRALMGTRADLISAGYAPLAPCTHALACPLLTHSQKDWCHMREHFQAPAWWLEIESFLPMKNRTLTYSYLLASRNAASPAFRGWARVIGDTLVEKGKTRQLICRGPEREFLSWLHKNGIPEQIAHGALVEGTDQAERKGSELRARPGLLKWRS